VSDQPQDSEFGPDTVARALQLISEGVPAEAVDLLRDLIAARRGGLMAQQALVRALAADGRRDEALACARELAMVNPHLAEAAFLLGETLLGTGSVPAAIAEFQRTLRLDPDHRWARIGLGRAWLEAGEPDRALASLSGVEAGDDPEVAALTSRAVAMRAQSRSDSGYVRHLFDQFAADYDARMLSELGYAAPDILKGLAALTLPGRSGLAILDLGCGTGLAGAAFKPIARLLHGIDLSPKMIEAAKRRGVYDDVRVGDIVSQPEFQGIYDLVVAADTLVYLGDLGSVLDNASLRLAFKGQFLFTVEKHAGQGYALGPKRRWQHSEDYLRSKADQHEFEVVGLMECVPRYEAGNPVEGFAVALETRRGTR
jgi:predicted TPR repeat methyltransferase